MHCEEKLWKIESQSIYKRGIYKVARLLTLIHRWGKWVAEVGGSELDPHLVCVQALDSPSQAFLLQIWIPSPTPQGVW